RRVVSTVRHAGCRASKPRLARLVGTAVDSNSCCHRCQANVVAVKTDSIVRTIALEEAFLHPRVWELFPASLQRKYEPVRARLSDVGRERIRQMDAAGIDMQVLSHVQPGIQVVPDDQADLAVEVCREVNDWLAEVVAAQPSRYAGFAMLPTQSPVHAADEL